MAKTDWEGWEIEKEERWEEGSCINAFCRKLFCEKIFYFFKSLHQKKLNFVEQILAIEDQNCENKFCKNLYL